MENAQAAFDSCDFSTATKVGETSPVVYTINGALPLYFACEKSGHCASGQKLAAMSGSAPAATKCTDGAKITGADGSCACAASTHNDGRHNDNAYRM